MLVKASMGRGNPVVAYLGDQTSSLTDAGKHLIAPIASHTQRWTG